MMSDAPPNAPGTGRLQPTCPRCGSAMIVIGHLTDAAGGPVGFVVRDAAGHARRLGAVKSCYCNDCGEVTLTLE